MTDLAHGTTESSIRLSIINARLMYNAVHLVLMHRQYGVRGNHIIIVYGGGRERERECSLCLSTTGYLSLCPVSNPSLHRTTCLCIRPPVPRYTGLPLLPTPPHRTSTSSYAVKADMCVWESLVITSRYPRSVRGLPRPHPDYACVCRTGE